MLAFLEGESIVVTSVLLTSTGALGPKPVSGLCLFGKTAKQKSVSRNAREWSCLEGRVEKECCAALEKVRDQAKCATCNALVRMCFEKNNKTLHYSDLEPQVRKYFRVWYARGPVYCLHLPSLARESPFPESETLAEFWKKHWWSSHIWEVRSSFWRQSFDCSYSFGVIWSPCRRCILTSCIWGKLPVVFVPLALGPCGIVRVVRTRDHVQTSAGTFVPSNGLQRVRFLLLESLKDRALIVHDIFL